MWSKYCVKKKKKIEFKKKWEQDRSVCFLDEMQT